MKFKLILVLSFIFIINISIKSSRYILKCGLTTSDWKLPKETINTNYPIGDLNFSDDLTLKNMYGVYIGVGQKVFLSNLLVYSLEINYRQKGFRELSILEGTLFGFPIKSQGDITYRLDYINLPFIFEYSVIKFKNLNLYVLAGPEISYAFYGRVRSKWTNLLEENSEPQITKDKFDFELNDELRRFEISGYLGLISYLNLKNNNFISYEVRYNRGLTSLNRNALAGKYACYNRNISLIFSYYFNKQD